MWDLEVTNVKERSTETGLGSVVTAHRIDLGTALYCGASRLSKLVCDVALGAVGLERGQVREGASPLALLFDEYA